MDAIKIKSAVLAVFGVVLLIVAWNRPVQSLLAALLPLYLSALLIISIVRFFSDSPCKFEEVNSYTLLDQATIRKGMNSLHSLTTAGPFLFLLILVPICDTLVVLVAGLILGGELLGLPAMASAEELMFTGKDMLEIGWNMIPRYSTDE